ncbi:hypothetical protein NNJEOMEG_00610 [Fundidesulfovibrio magnetotacticus]|uniref:DUF4239 domain-containing protein n=1 Tax=Fundidesulfovibrio magnetotacticus TaxID=2730080 RepID=A0A6V8LJ83_9BACT|nr:DUF4239 domain-containing protein [Fundidesulfovibrio magnetotacticus]GFK92783.1 hypothetical protein NNJEOMEG_00610 [Fundidesulfovibrio magnetotacticus]
MTIDLKNTLLVCAAVLALLAMVKRLGSSRPHRLSLAQKNLIATNFGSFTTLYTLFLGLAVVTLLQDYNSLEEAATQEADLLRVEHELSRELPGSGPFREALRAHVGWVMGPGWERMARGERDDGGEEIYRGVWQALHGMAVPDAQAAQLRLFILDKMVDINRLRHRRMLAASGNLYTPIWVLVLLGAFFTVAGFYFIDAEHPAADLFFAAMMLSLVLGNVFILYELDTPYSGIIHIGPERFAALHAAMAAPGGG